MERLFAGLGVLFLTICTQSADARSFVTDVRDEVHGNTTIMMEIHSSRYQEFTNENAIGMSCYPGGGVALWWWVGGRFSGENIVGRDVSYKFDSDPVRDVKWPDLDGIGVSGFYNDLISHKRLVIVDGRYGPSDNFDISDLRAKIGPKSLFYKQCNADLTDKPKQPASNPFQRAGDLVPIQRTQTPPPYPTISERLGEKGTTVLKLMIGVEGVVTSATVEKTSGYERLDAAAIEYVKAHWRWQPVSASGKPTVASASVSIEWPPKSAN